MAKMSVGGCRIRDVVRDSKIHWDALSKIGRNFDADHDRQQAGRVFPRTQFGEIGECDELIQITSKNSEYLSTEKSLFDQQSTQAFEPKVKLPTFDGSSVTLDFLDWFDMFEDYFEAVDLPDAVKCKLVASKLKGVARIWWKELQNHTFSGGEDLINSWPRMRELLLKKFLHTSCLTYFHNQPNKQENEDEVKHANCSTICPLQSVKAKQEEIDAGGSSKDDALSTGRNDSFMLTTCLAKFPNQLNKLEEAVKWIEMQPTSFVATSNLMKGITVKEQKDGAGYRVDTKHIFNTSENGKELGCTTKLNDAKDEQSRQQIHLMSNNIDLLVGELLMVSFDPGGVSSGANTILSLIHKADAELKLIGDSAASTCDVSVQTRLKIRNVEGLVLKRRLELVDLSKMTHKDQHPDTAFDIAIDAIDIDDVDVGHILEQGKLLIIKVDSGINSWAGTFISSFSFISVMEKLALNLVFENVLWPCVAIPMSRFVPTCVDAYLTPFIKAYLYGFLSKFNEIGGQPNIYLEYISIRVTIFVGVQFAQVYLIGIIEACESALCLGLFVASPLYPFEVPSYAHLFSISLVPFGLKTTELVSPRSYCLRVLGCWIGGKRLNLERVDKSLRYVKLERKWLLLGYIKNIIQYLTMFASPVSQTFVLTFVPLFYNPAMSVLGVGQALLRYIYDVSYLELRLLRFFSVEHLWQISSIMKVYLLRCSGHCVFEYRISTVIVPHWESLPALTLLALGNINHLIDCGLNMVAMHASTLQQLDLGFFVHVYTQGVEYYNMASYCCLCMCMHSLFTTFKRGIQQVIRNWQTISTVVLRLLPIIGILANREWKLVMTMLSVFTISSWLSILWDNEHFRKTLKLFHKLVNGLDPPTNVDGKLVRPIYGFLRVRSRTSFWKRRDGLM